MCCITNKRNSPTLVIPRHWHPIVKSIIEYLGRIRDFYNRAPERLGKFLSVAFQVFYNGCVIEPLRRFSKHRVSEVELPRCRVVRI